MVFPSFHRFGSEPLEKLLRIQVPPLAAGRTPLRQLNYIEQYAQKLECSSVVIEEDYIDRDYIEDHSIFYSRSRQPLPNHCIRVHFFRRVDEAVLRDRLSTLADEYAKSKNLYAERCKEFSEECYLGFMVVKPLHGCPVGRTVLRTFPREGCRDGNVREFRGSLKYDAHLLGVNLTVLGLAFQQQDEGVSACATTAIWSSLQKLKSTEEVSAATPAQITTHASRFSLPYGRPMPSEGLSLDQMCQAIHALAISPDLLRTSTYELARKITYAAALSDTTPILIIAHARLGKHAVTVAGVKRAKEHRATPSKGCLDDRSIDLAGLYIHDDRIGPYVRADLTSTTESLRAQWGGRIEANEKAAQLTISVNGAKEEWLLTHVLTPIHNKVRLSFSQMFRIADEVARMLYRALLFQSLPLEKVSFGVRIIRGHNYVGKLLLNSSRERRERFFGTIAMSRYVGLILLQAGVVGPFNVLVDTTGTPRNARCLGIINRGEANAVNIQIGNALAEKYNCPFVE